MDKKLDRERVGVIKVITSRKDTYCVKTLHPRNEVMRAKDLCDIRHTWRDFGVFHTVSKHFVNTVEEYGRGCLGLDVRYFIDDKEVTYDDMLDCFFEGEEALERVINNFEYKKNNNKKSND